MVTVFPVGALALAAGAALEDAEAAAEDEVADEGALVAAVADEATLDAGADAAEEAAVLAAWDTAGDDAAGDEVAEFAEVAPFEVVDAPQAASTPTPANPVASISSERRVTWVSGPWCRTESSSFPQRHRNRRGWLPLTPTMLE